MHSLVAIYIYVARKWLAFCSYINIVTAHTYLLCNPTVAKLGKQQECSC